jgi:GNAT superfamily N-acetyltransferase
MNPTLTHRKATLKDLRSIVELLIEDELGAKREHLGSELDPAYIKAFELIDIDPNQYLMVVELGDQIAGTCHLTMMPSLTFTGSVRMQIEAVRVKDSMRGQKIGAWMISEAFDYARSAGASIVQLTTNKQRPRAKTFYEKLGFEASHEGMKVRLN